MIINYAAPIGGVSLDDDGNPVPRLRCASCGQPVDMRRVNPSRPPKRKMIT